MGNLCAGGGAPARLRAPHQQAPPSAHQQQPAVPSAAASTNSNSRAGRVPSGVANHNHTAPCEAADGSDPSARALAEAQLLAVSRPGAAGGVRGSGRPTAMLDGAAAAALPQQQPPDAAAAAAATGDGDAAPPTSLEALLNENLDLRASLAQARVQLEETSKAMMEHLAARQDLEKAMVEMQSQFAALKGQNHQLKRRVSHLTTGHMPADMADEAAAAVRAQQMESTDKTGRVLLVLRDSNPHSQLPVLWRGADYKGWEGVRLEDGAVTGLALSGLQLSTVPPEVGDLASLSALLLSNNMLRSLPPSVRGLSQLTYLLLDGNELTQLPVEITELTQLQTLWLQDNRLAAVPSTLGHMQGLRQLLLSNNALTALPDSIGDLPRLTSLWLDNNRLVGLPSSVSRLTSLHRLRVDAALADKLPAELQPMVQAAQAQGPSVASHASGSAGGAGGPAVSSPRSAGGATAAASAGGVDSGSSGAGGDRGGSAGT